MNAARLLLWLVITGGAGLCNPPTVLAQSTAADACLDQPMEVSWTPPDSGDKAKAAGKGLLSSVLGVSSGDDRPELARRPRLPKATLEFADPDLEVELQGGTIDGELIMAVRVRKDREEGGPHLVALQDINCRVLMPARVEIFELWEKGSLSVSWSSSTYSDGRLVGSDSGAFDSSWAEIRQRYPGNADIPGIWQSYGEPPLDGIRGVTATFALPPGETFEPSDWYLVTHITQPSDTPGTVNTLPVVSEIEPGDKERYGFSQARNVRWQPQAPARTLALGVNTNLYAAADQGLVCKDDCKRILEGINQLECAREDCDDAKRAVDDALASLADARDALAAAESEVAAARSALQAAGRAMDEARAALEAAQSKLDIESAKQRRLQESLARGGHGLGAEQTRRAIESSRGYLDSLEARVASAEAAAGNAQYGLDLAEATLTAAGEEAEAAQQAVGQSEEAVAAARQVLSDCMQAEWQRCRDIEELWAQYHDCRDRCRAQDETREEIDRAGRYVEERAEATARDAGDFDDSRRRVSDNSSHIRDLAGESPEAVRDLVHEATQKRIESERLDQEARAKLTSAENDYRNGDLDSAEAAADEARQLADQAGEAMEEADRLVGEAESITRREYERLLEQDALRKQAEWLAERRAVNQKKQACMVLVGQYFAADGDDTALLEDMGAFVSGEAKDALDEARSIEYTPERMQEFLDRLESQRHRLEQLLSLLNGIGDNVSIEARNQAFGTALEIAGELSGRVPGLSEFFNFYSSAFNAAVEAIFAIQDLMLGGYKDEVDRYVRGRSCCSYDHEQLLAMSMGKGLQEWINQGWVRYKQDNSAVLARLSGDSERKLEAYFKSRLALRFATCCIEYALDG